MAKTVEIGRVFGAWVVLEQLPYGQKYLCRCECGNLGKVRVYDLLGSPPKSSMCKSCSSALASSNGTKTETSGEYSSWLHMNSRCFSPTDNDFKNYGGRGITVCDLWKDSYESFYLCMGKKPTPTCTIERKDVNGNYCPENCVWLERSLQPKNQRSCVFLTAFGETKLVSDWLRDPRCAVRPTTLYNRITAGKMSHEEAITTPAKKK